MSTDDFRWSEEPWLVIDVETTGLDPKSGDKIVELSAVEFNGGVPGEIKSWLINPNRDIPEEVSALHGITCDTVKGAPTIEDVADEFLEFASKFKVYVAYNWPFDNKFLSAAFGSAWDDITETGVVVDPLVIVRLDEVGRWWSGKGRHKLTNVAGRLLAGAAIDDIIEKAHSASADALMAGYVLWHLREHVHVSAEEVDEFIKIARKQESLRYNKWLSAKKRKEAATQ